jgi:hypothetical protein
MAQKRRSEWKHAWRALPICSGALLVMTFSAGPLWAADAETEQRLKQLEQQNQALQEKLKQQQALIDDLANKLSKVEEKTASGTSSAPGEASVSKGFGLGQVRISGEGGVGVFHTSKGGQYYNAPFRVDEAKLFVEAPVWQNYVFAYAELDLLTRERQVAGPADEAFHLGELYVDFEALSRLWDKPGMLGLRAGRIDIPFGEEYATRDAIDNPLISHSLTDFWGVDEGVELYGGVGKFDYVFAVQNGGHPMLADFDRDKSFAGRVGWRPKKWLRVSASGMRTGALDAADDFMSELWFGNGFIRAIGAGATSYGAQVYEGDVQGFWKTGHVKAAGGILKYDDNSPTGSASDRDLYFYYVEAMQRLPQLTKLYGAARFSQIFVEDGFPIVGHGDFGEYFFDPGAMTDRMWRASVGGGYQFSEHLNFKVEYTIERRHELESESENLHFVAAEIAFAF